MLVLPLLLESILSKRPLERFIDHTLTYVAATPSQQYDRLWVHPLTSFGIGIFMRIQSGGDNQNEGLSRHPDPTGGHL